MTRLAANFNRPHRRALSADEFAAGRRVMRAMRGLGWKLGDCPWLIDTAIGRWRMVLLERRRADLFWIYQRFDRVRSRWCGRVSHVPTGRSMAEFPTAAQAAAFVEWALGYSDAWADLTIHSVTPQLRFGVRVAIHEFGGWRMDGPPEGGCDGQDQAAG